MASPSKYKARCIINTALIKLNYSGSYVKYILMIVAITINITAANKSITLAVFRLEKNLNYKLMPE